MHSLIGLVQTIVKQTRRVPFVWSREVVVGNPAQPDRTKERVRSK